MSEFIEISEQTLLGDLMKCVIEQVKVLPKPKLLESERSVGRKKDPSQIHCCGCGETVTARLTDGREIYPHRQDLSGLPFWKCDTCGNYVGCHREIKLMREARAKGVTCSAKR